MEDMEAMVQRIFSDYPHLIQEEARFERHLDQRENPEMRDALTILKMKISTIESWLTLLDIDEKFALRQELIKNQEESSSRRAALMWVWQIFKEGRTPCQLQEQAVAKIIKFAIKHKDITNAIFGENHKHNFP